MDLATVAVRPRFTLPQARALFPGLNLGVEPVLPLEHAQVALREASARAMRGSGGLLGRDGRDLFEGILALRKAIDEAVAEARATAGTDVQGNA